MRDVTDLVRQSLLDEFHGNISAAFEEACRRYANEIMFSDRCEKERDEWRKGASWAYLRLTKPAEPKPVDDVPTPITDDWIATGKEA